MIPHPRGPQAVVGPGCVGDSRSNLCWTDFQAPLFRDSLPLLIISPSPPHLPAPPAPVFLPPSTRDWGITVPPGMGRPAGSVCYISSSTELAPECDGSRLTSAPVVGTSAQAAGEAQSLTQEARSPVVPVPAASCSQHPGTQCQPCSCIPGRTPGRCLSTVSPRHPPR